MNHSTPEKSNIALVSIVTISLFCNVFLVGFAAWATLSPETHPIRNILLQIEYDKVGGRGNYETMNHAQRLSLTDPQNPSSLVHMQEYINSFSGGVKNPSPQDGSSATQTKTMTLEEVATLKKDAAIEGKDTAKILVVEYSDMECPFCMKQYHETKLSDTIKSQYGETVGFVFKNNRGVNHPGTEAKAIAALCAQKVGGNAKYIQYYRGIMDKTMNNNQVFPVGDLATLAKSVGLDTAKWQSCVDKKETATVFQSQTSEAQKFGLGGTPGTLIVNVETGKYGTIEGAYPYTQFASTIDSLLK